MAIPPALNISKVATKRFASPIGGTGEGLPNDIPPTVEGAVLRSSLIILLLI